MDAVKPTSADEGMDGDTFVKMPGDSFMQISMGKSGFSESLKLAPESIQTPVSRDTLKSVAENFSFTKNEPQGMLMNFLMKTKPTMRPILMTTTMAPNMIWTEEPTIRDFFSSESSGLDNSINGNFIHMKMGDKEPKGVEPSVMPKLEKTKIALDLDGNSFMSMQVGDDVLRERMSSVDDTM